MDDGYRRVSASMENQFNHKNQNCIGGTKLIPSFVNILLSKDTTSYSHELIGPCDASSSKYGKLHLAACEGYILLSQKIILKLLYVHSIATNLCQ